MVTNALYRFTFQYTPDEGETIETDPPDPTINVILTLTRTQTMYGPTGSDVVILSATSQVKIDKDTSKKVIFPVLSGSVTGPNKELSLSTSEQVKVEREVYTYGYEHVNLEVRLTLDTTAHYKFISSGGGGGPPGGPPGRGGLAMPGGPPPADAMLSSIARIVPTVSLMDIVLKVPDTSVFPELFPIPSNDSRNRYVYSTLTTGVLLNGDWSADVFGVDASDLLPHTTFTSFAVGPIIGQGDTISVGAGNSIRQRFTYTNLPPLNSHFGDKKVLMIYTAPQNPPEPMPASTTQTAHVQVFFSKNSHNHPLPDVPTLDGKTPNWFFYWSQTPAGLGYSYKYGGSHGSVAGQALWLSNQWTSVIYNKASQSSGVGEARTGIDLFAAVVRHEKHHLDDFNVWWPNNRVPNDDLDGDMIPDADEETLTHTWTPPYPYLDHDEYYDPTLPATHSDDFGYGVYSGWNDSEDHAHHWNDKWDNGTADREDWSKPGKQWK